MKVKFLSDAIIETENGREVEHKAGATVELSDDSAWRWIRRCKAVPNTKKGVEKLLKQLEADEMHALAENLGNAIAEAESAKKEPEPAADEAEPEADSE